MCVGYSKTTGAEETKNYTLGIYPGYVPSRQERLKWMSSRSVAPSDAARGHATGSLWRRFDGLVWICLLMALCYRRFVGRGYIPWVSYPGYIPSRQERLKLLSSRSVAPSDAARGHATGSLWRRFDGLVWICLLMALCYRRFVGRGYIPWVYTQQTRTIEIDELKIGRSERCCPRPRHRFPHRFLA